MPDYAQMILEIRRMGMSANGIVRVGLSRGREKFTEHAIHAIVHRNSKRISAAIRETIEEIHAFLYKS